MLEKLTIKNFKSFGVRQRIPLEPITVLVGPNNSGKSNFLSLGRLVANAVIGGGEQAINIEGGVPFLFHRPSEPGSNMEISWDTDQGGYSVVFSKYQETNLVQIQESLFRPSMDDLCWINEDGQMKGPSVSSEMPEPFFGLGRVAKDPAFSNYFDVCKPLVESSIIKLQPDAMRMEAPVVPEPKLQPNGQGLAAVLGLWRGAYPDRISELEETIRHAIPEIQQILVRPGPTPSHQRLWIRQRDGQEFDALHLSDGILCCIALAIVVIGAGPGALVCIEEPEQSVHPQLIRNLIDLMRRMVRDNGCQFILATHSMVLMDAFKDEPESILRFSRAKDGTRTEQLSDLPKLMEALHRSSPGEMVETGLFQALDAPDGVTDP